MPVLIRTTRFGNPSYAITYHDGGTDPLRTKRNPGDEVVEISDAQAALGLDVVSALHETGRLKAQ